MLLQTVAFIRPAAARNESKSGLIISIEKKKKKVAPLKEDRHMLGALGCHHRPMISSS